MTTRPSSAEDALSDHVWRKRYRVEGENDQDASFRRVARAVARVEQGEAGIWEGKFHGLMGNFAFLPGGRILAGAGTNRRVTLFNCFVMGTIEDSIEGIFCALQEGALTLQQGGGIGYDFSTLRPRGRKARETGTIASGPVSFMHVWDRMCATMLSTGGRRGAMMATLRCDHPDIEEYIDAKREAGVLAYFNLSVLVTDAFLEAVREDREWPLVFPDAEPGAETVERNWPGRDDPVACTVHRRVSARALWDRLMRAAYDSAEPGVLFIDRINRMNNLSYCERINATNPCGEVPLPPYGACNLGSINLTKFVREPFSAHAAIDERALAAAVRTAARLLDNVIDISRFPLPAQHGQAVGSRRIGLGIMGLADALVMLGMRYDSEEARSAAQGVMRSICHEAYRASVELAHERGTFPLFDRERYLAAPFIAALPGDIRDGIARHGIRNSHLTAIAPTGSISLVAGGVSSGLEPLMAPEVERKILQDDGSWREFTSTSASVRLWRSEHAGLPPAFVTLDEIAPKDQLAMQAGLQPHVDNAISKTLTIPEDFPFEDFAALYQQANALGLKGCTAFRPGGVRACLVKPAGQPS
jgi:ribonucleoside-diphosphate reductase alpha chain